MKLRGLLTIACGLALTAGSLCFHLLAAEAPGNKQDATALATASIAKMEVGKTDWPQWGGWSGRNNTPPGSNIPSDWDVGSGENIKWVTPLGSNILGSPVVANGKIYVGTNNTAGLVKRFPSNKDLGCLVCLDEKTGKFLWQHSSEKLALGASHDYGLQGICCSPCVDGNRLWFVTSRGEVACLDTEGFTNGNDGPYKSEENENKDEADVIWKFDMMAELKTLQFYMCSCSVTCAGDVLLVNTGNGVDESGIEISSPEAPSFIALDRRTGKLLWTDNTASSHLTDGQWSSTTYAVLGKTPQAIFAGADGWIYSFDPQGENGRSKLLWKFDTNAKTAKWKPGGRGDRNSIVSTPVVYNGLLYCPVGQNPENGGGQGILWCIDPTKRGDVSPTLALDKAGKPLKRRRFQAVDIEAGEKEVPNPNSAAVWHFDTFDANGNKKVDFEETVHRSIGSVAVKNDLLFLADYDGLFHCIDARTGKPHWAYDMFAPTYGTPLIVDGKVYIGDEDGDVAIFELADKQNMIAEINMDDAVVSTPIVANNILYIANRRKLFAIEAK